MTRSAALHDDEVLPVWNALLDDHAPGERSTRLAILLVLATGLRAEGVPHRPESPISSAWILTIRFSAYALRT